MTPSELKSSRKSLGLSAARLAALTGVTVNAVRKWESGRNPIPPWLVLLMSLFELRAVQRRLGVSATTLAPTSD